MHTRRPRNARPFERGFTLVEIMVVIVILGLLATMVAHNVIRAADDEARQTKALTDCKTIAAAARGYRAKHGQWPDPLQTLWRSDDRGGSELEPVIADPWGEAYLLRAGERADELCVISPGPDRVPDTEDDITSAVRREC